MFNYPFSNEIGAGDIPKEVQQAIWREINFRLGDRDEKSPLTRLEKSLVLIRISGVMMNSMRAHLYALEAVKAGATLDQVVEATVSVIMSGMLRWNMATMGALRCAEQWAAHHNLQPRTPPILEDHLTERIEELRGYVRKSLNREFPDLWECLLKVAPSVLDGYMRMRMEADRGAIPKPIKELMIIGADIVQGNSWGAEVHAGQAIRDGATVEQVMDTVALAMLEIGQSAYRTGGMDAIKGAKEAETKIKNG